MSDKTDSKNLNNQEVVEYIECSMKKIAKQEEILKEKDKEIASLKEQLQTVKSANTKQNVFNSENLENVLGSLEEVNILRRGSAVKIAEDFQGNPDSAVDFIMDLVESFKNDPTEGHAVKLSSRKSESENSEDGNIKKWQEAIKRSK